VGAGSQYAGLLMGCPDQRNGMVNAVPVRMDHDMAVTSFEVDERTAALLTQLQKKFGVKTNAAVIRKALALANVAAEHADSDIAITIAPSEGKPAVKVLLDE
jgi:hypothetical protein